MERVRALLISSPSKLSNTLYKTHTHTINKKYTLAGHTLSKTGEYSTHLTAENEVQKIFRAELCFILNLQFPLENHIYTHLFIYILMAFSFL